MAWRITFANGDEEITPPEVDRVVASVGADYLYAQSTRTYGPDEIIATYPIGNIRKWEKIKEGGTF